jgi:hypothetical protein
VRVGYDQNGVATLSFSGTVGQFADDEVPYHVLGNYPGTTSGGYPVSTNGFTKALSSGSVAAGSKQDTREVTITRNGARQVGMVPAQNGKVYGEWVDPDGTAHGDTTFSYWTVFTGGLSIGVADHANWETFTPAFKGAWPVWLSIWAYPNTYTNPYLGDPLDPLYSMGSGASDFATANARTQNAAAVRWNWSPWESEDWELFAKWEAPDGNGNNWVPNGWGDPGITRPHPAVTQPLSYTVTASFSSGIAYLTNLGLLDGASCTANYYLTFHDPVDGWHTNGPKYEVDPLLFPYTVDGKPVSQAAGTTLNTSYPDQLDFIDYGPGVRGVGGLLAGGSVLAPLAGPWGIGLAGVMAVTSFAAGTYDTPTPTTPKDVPTDLGSFQQDIQDQVKINNGTAVATPFGAPNYVVVPSVPRFADINRANALAAMTPTQQGQYWVGTGLGGKFMITATDVLHQIIQPYAAYQFDTAELIVDAAGKPSYAFANVKQSGALEAVRTWTWVVTNPPTQTH